MMSKQRNFWRTTVQVLAIGLFLFLLAQNRLTLWVILFGAAALGCSREAVSRALGEMKREGLVESRDGHLLVTDPSGLEDIL